MQRLIPIVYAGLFAIPTLFGQAATHAQVQLGNQTARQQQMNSLSEPDQPARKQDSAKLSSEESDDPTLHAGVPVHEPSRDARKAAQHAEHLSRKGNREESIAEFRRALEIDPQYYEAGIDLALELEASGKMDDAEKELIGLTRAEPAHVLGFTNLATLLCEEHRYLEAESVARQSLKRHPFSFRSNYLLGVALVQQGKWTGEAKTSLEYSQVKCAGAKPLLDSWPKQASASGTR